MRGIKWRDVCTFCLFVVLSTVLWFGHAMNSVRNAMVTIPITYTGIPNEVGMTGKGLPQTLEVEVRDAGQRLRLYQRIPPRLTIDLSAQTHAKKGTIRVSSDVLRRSVTDLLQGTSKLVQVSPEEIVCEYYRQQQKTVPVVWQGAVVPAPEYQQTAEPILTPSTVKIYGRAEVLDTIRAVETEPVAVQNVKDTMSFALALKAPAGTRLGTDSVVLTAYSERYTEKVLKVALHTENVPAGEYLRIFPETVEVTLRVSVLHFADVTENDVVAYCSYPNSVKGSTLPIELRYSNPYISAARVYPEEVEYIIEK